METVTLLLDRGIDLNASNRKGWTPLHWAARNDHRELVAFLLERGADRTAMDKYGRTPLDVAEEEAQQEAAGKVARLLRERGDEQPR